MRILFNTIIINLNDKMKNNEFGYTFTNCFSLSCKVWEFADYWKVLLIHDSDH